MIPDTIKHLGAEFHHAAEGVGEALQRLERARLDRLAFLRQCSKDSTARLAALKEEVRALPEQIAKCDAEAARLESQTAEDLLRQALEAGRQEQPQPELYRPGLPPERLRKVWAEWEMVDGVVYVFQGNKYRCTYRPTTEWWDIGAEHTWHASYRPHGATWAEVEAKADEAEREQGELCPIGSQAIYSAHAGARGRSVFALRGHWLGSARKQGKTGSTLLDLTKLPPGTVCETLEDIPRWNGRTIAAGVRFTLRDTSAAEGDEFPMVVTTNGENAYCIPALVPARVVKEGGER